MRNLITMFDFFFFSKRKNTVSSETNANDGTLTTSNIDILISENPQIKNFAPPTPPLRPPPPKVRILVPSLQPTRTDLFFSSPFSIYKRHTHSES